MLVRVATEWHVLGLPWWPFDGAVTAALIALVGTAITISWNGWRFKAAEKGQRQRHSEAVASNEKLGGRQELLTDLRRAEDALATNDKLKWIYAGVTLRQINESEHATDTDRRRARQIIAAYKGRVTPRVR